mgnify:CR=1 FL=1
MSEQPLIEDPHFDPWSVPLEDLDPAQPALFEADAHWDLFKRLRDEDPVHYTPDGPHGAYWSVTRYEDIFYVDTDAATFSSASGIGLPRKPAATDTPRRELTAEQKKQRE